MTILAVVINHDIILAAQLERRDPDPPFTAMLIVPRAQAAEGALQYWESIFPAGHWLEQRFRRIPPSELLEAEGSRFDTPVRDRGKLFNHAPPWLAIMSIGVAEQILCSNSEFKPGFRFILMLSLLVFDEAQGIGEKASLLVLAAALYARVWLVGDPFQVGHLVNQYNDEEVQINGAMEAAMVGLNDPKTKYLPFEQLIEWMTDHYSFESLHPVPWHTMVLQLLSRR